ncbi:multicopper oxidase [Actibacterium atlanticum]|uniref:Multicopper oxidase n=2 Tax=Actibacterium atlanticum TaxID=1461693 RepID=A0A058ZIQ7_9RHOB|nr:multicopper oxidase [Actibacterium atlanticum]
MILNRRDMLLGTMASVLVPRPAVSKTSGITLRPAPMSVQWPGRTGALAGFLGFNGSLPGPEIRVKQGDRLRVRLENGLDDGALVHWHGIRVPNRMDGVSILTQEVVPPGEAFDYEFSPPDAGTYWYHSHYLSYEQVGRGLFGPLIVEEKNPPEVDHDITAILADFRMTPAGEFDTDFGVMEDFARWGRLGIALRVFLSQSSVRLGDRVRLRLINAAIDRVFPLDLNGINGSVVALDGMPLAQPTALEPMTIAPGQRVDIIGTVISDVSISTSDGDSLRQIGRISMKGTNPTPGSELIQPLPAHGLPTPIRPGQSLKLVMRGGEGDPDHGGFGTWSFNGVSGLPMEPLGQFRWGDTAEITLSNPTAFDHGIHLHGHHFREVLGSGPFGPWRDTLLVKAGEDRKIACVFDNPGRWLLHCHMLSHSADGMATWVEVT